jgi:lactoylglutathione lyase
MEIQSKLQGGMDMWFNMEHNCICVTDLEKTIQFYEKALQMKVTRKKQAADRDIVFLGGGKSPHLIEVIHMHDHPQKYQLGENPTHLAFRTDLIEEAKQMHKQMGCFDHELPEFGVYFITDPDGYLCEIMPTRK